MELFPVKATVPIFGFKIKVTVTERDFVRFVTDAFGQEIAAKIMALLAGISAGVATE